MEIILKDKEIEQAMINHIGSMGLNIANKNISVSFIAGRGANGNTAHIELLPAAQGGSVTAVTEVEQTSPEKGNQEEEAVATGEEASDDSKMFG